MFFPGENAFDPERDPDGMLAQMTELSAEWVRGHRGGERGFCMGHFDPGTLQDMGQQVLAAAQAIAFSPTLPPRTPDVVYSQTLVRQTRSPNGREVIQSNRQAGIGAKMIR